MEFEKVKSYLSEQVDENGTSIYSHIAAISRKIVEEKPEDAYKLFENISLEVKNSKLKATDSNDIKTIPFDESQREFIQNNINTILTLYGRKAEKKVKQNQDDDEEEQEEDEKEEEEEPVDMSKCANLLQNQQLLSWSGISMESDELCQLQHCFMNLVRKNPNIETSRFWGKVQAMNNDYYIVETKLTEYPEVDETADPKQEEPGKGINEFVYFVITNLENGDWTQLKDVTPAQIKTSRQVYRLFSGDLNASVGGRVHFEWTEAELLRAQIARITSSTMLCPTDYYTKPEEEDEDNPFVIELNEEFAPNEEGGATEDAWVHSRGHLRLEGRLKKWIEPEKDEDEDENEDEEAEEKEPNAEELEEEIAILQSIANDKCAEFGNGGDEDDDDTEGSNVWYIREVNKNMPYKVVVINNKLWNGAKTIYLSNSKQFVNIYIGNGIKYRGDYYTPVPPLPIPSQFDEMKESEMPDPENEDEVITTKESIFVVQKEQMPPKEPEKDENDDADKENGDEEEEEEDID